MDWNAVRRHNRKASARKAKRERLAAEQAARVEAAGGPVKVGELRAATREVRRCRDTFWTKDFDAEVWALRGKEWVFADWNDVVLMFPFCSYRERLDSKDAVPVTTGAAKWLRSEWAKSFGKPNR